MQKPVFRNTPGCHFRNAFWDRLLSLYRDYTGSPGKYWLCNNFVHFSIRVDAIRAEQGLEVLLPL